MYFLYSLLLTVGFIVFLPKFAIDALRTRKYVTGLSQRLGKLPAIIPRDHPVIWIHCVSVGETEAARPLVRALLDRFPSHRLVVSTTTVTGQRGRRHAFGQEAAAAFYFPIDWADRKSTRLNSSHQIISYAVFCLKKKSKVTSRFIEARESPKPGNTNKFLYNPDLHCRRGIRSREQAANTNGNDEA